MNNYLVSFDDGIAVTTSLAIAEGVGNPHKSVIQLIRQNLNDLREFGSLAFEMRVARSDGRGGQQAEVAILNEQQSTLLLTYMRNIDVVRAFKKRLVKAFYELAERANNPGANLTRMDLIKMALDSEEKRLQLESTVEEMTPKALFHDQCARKPGAISLAEAAKIIGTGRNRFAAFLRQKHWLTRKNEPYQERIESGDLDVKLGSWEHPTEGLQRSVTALVTGKGLTKLQRLWRGHTEGVAA
jgi:phage antirepressor YoqD-like protein